MVYDIELSPWILNPDGSPSNVQARVRLYRTKGDGRMEMTDLIGNVGSFRLEASADGEDITTRIFNPSTGYVYVPTKDTAGNGYQKVSVRLYTGSTAQGWTLRATTEFAPPKSGAPGEAGMVRAPMRFSEWTSGNVGMKYYSGDQDGDLWSDIVYRKIVGSDGVTSTVWGHCIQTFTKQASDSIDFMSVKRNEKDCFRAASQFNMVATDLLLALNAYISFFSGNSIRLYDSGNSLKGEFLGGGRMVDGHNIMGWLGGSAASPNWAVDDTGKTYVGGTSGQRIELDPLNKSMQVFDSSGNLVATHSGRIITESEAVPPASAGQTTEVQLTNKECQLSISTSEAYNYVSEVEIAILNTPTGTNGGLQVSIPALTLGCSMSGAGNSWFVSSSLVLDCLSSAGSMITTLCPGAAQLTASSPSKTIAAQTIDIPVETKKVKLRMRAYARGSTGSGTATFSSSGKMTAKFVAKWYRCEYGANGWVISYDSNNYEYCLVIGNKLKRKIMCNGNPILSSD